MTKLEEVAIAIFDAQERLHNDNRKFENAYPWRQQECMVAARAAAEALKDPPEVVRDALCRACSTDCFAGCDCGGVWDVGLDAILNEVQP
jgi:hypothetical protein